LDFLEKVTFLEPSQLIIYLDLDAERAIERIDGRLRDGQCRHPTRSVPRWKHPHETLDNLKNLRIAYHEVLDVLEDRGVSVELVDASKTLEELESEVTGIIRDYRASRK